MMRVKEMFDLIPLDIPSLDYTRFISAWLYSGKDGNLLIDPGPACTVNTLFDALAQRGVRHLDYILLTHIHMDHSGGIGHVIERYPEAKVVCHEQAVRHLLDPARLYDGSVKVLGHVAEVYGPIKPVPEANILTTGRIPFAGGIIVVPTPGHAAHHQCFVFGDRLFCGEVFGIFLDLKDTFYLRPATPPVFVLDDYLASMDTVAPYVDRRICFAHYGSYPDGAAILKTARQQLLLWVERVAKHGPEDDIDLVIADLEKNDPVYARKDALAPQVRARETYFSANSIKGIRQYLQKR